MEEKRRHLSPIESQLLPALLSGRNVQLITPPIHEEKALLGDLRDEDFDGECTVFVIAFVAMTHKLRSLVSE